MNRTGIKNKKRIVMNDIPPKGFFTRPYVSGTVRKLRTLNVGNFVEMPHKQAKGSYNCANYLGIKIVTRKFDEDITRVYRVG